MPVSLCFNLVGMSWCLIVALISICLLSYEFVGCLDSLYCKVPCSYNLCPNFSVILFVCFSFFDYVFMTECMVYLVWHACAATHVSRPGGYVLESVLSFRLYMEPGSRQACDAVFASCAVSPIRVGILSATGLIVLLSFTTGLPFISAATFLSLL